MSRDGDAGGLTRHDRLRLPTTDCLHRPGFAVCLAGLASAQTNSAQFFNLLNRANFDLPNRLFGTANVGRIFSARNARERQLGLKVSW